MGIVAKRARLGCALLTLTALLGGCSGATGSSASDAGSATPMSLQGQVHGGQAPIVGSSVSLRAASEQGLSNASTVATSTTDSNGNFNFSFTCPSPTSEMYITSTGGNPGGGTNTAIHLMALLGPCQNLNRSATVNELTTVAAAYVANGFIGASGCDDCGGGLPTDIDNINGPAPGLPNAMGNAALLVNSFTGLDAPTLPTSADCSGNTPPVNCLTVKKLNTAANALAACVNSSGPTSAQCVQLFDCASVGAVFSSSTACSPGVGSALPTDTLTAMLNIARNPGKISAPGIDDTSNRDVVFSPAYASPNHFSDYTMSLNLTGDFNGPTNLAVDSAGDIWVTSYSSGSAVELSPNGVPLSGSSGFAAGGGTFGIAFGPTGNAWVGNYGSALYVLSPAGLQILGSPITTGGLQYPFGIAASPNGDIWVVDSTNGSTVADKVSRFAATGSAYGTGYATGSNPLGVAVDASGYVFVANSGSNTVSELNPSGSLVKTISDGSLKNPNGIAIDPNGNLWVANYGSNSITKISLANESEISAANFPGGGLNSAVGIAIDAAGNAWVTNYAGNTSSGLVAEFSSSGVALSPSTGFVGAGIDTSPDSVTPAIDPSGNVWLASEYDNSVTVLFGAAAPTRTPLVGALTQGFVP